MITTILLIIGTFIGIIISLIYSFRWPLTILLSIILIIMLIKVRKEAKAYGFKSLFKAFKKQSSDNEIMNLVEFIVKRNIGLHHTIRLEEKNICICVSKSGIYLIKILDYIGKISKTEDEDILVLKNERTTLIPNFMLELKELEEMLYRDNSSFVIKKLIIKKETCIILFPYEKEYKVLGIRDLYYKFKQMNKATMYSEEQIKDFTLQIENILSNSVKFLDNACYDEKTRLQSK